MFRAKVCSKHVELILDINKLLLLHLVDFLCYFTYNDDARSNTNPNTITFILIGDTVGLTTTQYNVTSVNRTREQGRLSTLPVSAILCSITVIGSAN